MLLHCGDARGREPAKAHLGHECSRTPAILHHHTHARRPAHPDNLAGSGEQTRKVFGPGRRGLDPKE